MPPAPGRDQVAAMSRLARIIAVLDHAGSTGASAERLVVAAGYPGTGAPLDQLGLDLRHLRRQGWQIDNVAGPGEPAVYRMSTRDNRLAVRLTDAQRVALHRAMLLADRGDLARRLGVTAAALPAGVGTAVVPHDAEPALARSLQAVRLRSRLRFSYKGVPRTVHPAGVRFRDRQWYLTGREESGPLVKHFAVGRMSEVALDPPGTAEEVAVERLTLHPLRWDIDPPEDVVLATAPAFEPDVEARLGVARHREERGAGDDAEVLLTHTVTHRAAFRARLHALGPRVRLVGASPFRDELLAELRDLAGLDPAGDDA